MILIWCTGTFICYDYYIYLFLIPYAFFSRPKWIVHMGVKYMHSDYVLIGWQSDDLPEFGHIQDIAVVNELAFFVVCVYHAYSVDHHYHSFAIGKTGEVRACLLRELVDNQSFRAHMLPNRSLYITFRSYIEPIH